MNNIGTVFRIMLFSTIGTVGILLPIIAIPAGLGILIAKSFKKEED